MRSGRWVTCWLALALVWLTACAPTAPAPTPSPPTPAVKAEATAAPKPTPVSPTPTPRPVKAKFGSPGFVSDAGVFIALDKGYFKEQRIEAEWAPVSSVDLFALLATGEVQAGGSNIDAGMLGAILRGINLKIAADKSSNFKGTRFWNIMVRKDLADQIKDPSDLKGRTIGDLCDNCNAEYGVDLLLKKGNLTLADVKHVVLASPADLIPAFINKAIDVAGVYEPFVTIATGQGVAVPWVWVSDLDPGNQGAVVLFGESLSKDVDAARRFMVAYVKGLRDYNDAFVKGKNKADIVQILTRYTSLKDPAMYDKVGMPGLHPDGKVNVPNLALQQDFFIKKGAMKEKVDLNKAVDMQFVEYALQKLGPYQ